MAEANKTTVYVDIDDEITGIIDKVTSAQGKIVALVLPKRASVLQSIVNMKLLKKSATASKKSLVLITSEAGLMPLAGAVGIHVAKSLQSKPEIPELPDHGDGADEEITEALEDEPKIDRQKSVGSLAAAAPLKDEDDTETIELDDIQVDDEKDATAPKRAKKKSKPGFKIPNFDRFRLGIILGCLALVLLIFGWILAAIILPKATVTIKTDSSTIVSNISFTANTALKDLDVDKALIPAVQKELKKTDTEKVTATGKKDNGAKATGSMTVYNCTDDDVEVPAGTVFKSGSYSFASDGAVSVPASDFNSGGICKKNRSASVSVTSTVGGTSSNITAGHEFTSNFASTLTGTGSAMAGGTSNIVTVISQSDVDGAVAKMKGRLDQAAMTELKQQLNTESLKGLDETKVVSEPAITANPAVGQEAGEVTVTAVTTYNILGVKDDYLSQIIKKNAEAKIDTSKQSILDDGLDDAVIRLETRKSPTEAQMNLQALVVAGPELHEDEIKDEIRGKKRGDAEKIIGSKTGVKDVTIEYSPFWVLSTPKSAKKITIVIEKPEVQATESTNQTSNDSSNP